MISPVMWGCKFLLTLWGSQTSRPFQGIAYISMTWARAQGLSSFTKILLVCWHLA